MSVGSAAFKWNFIAVNQLGQKFISDEHTRSHVLAEEAFASNTSCVSLFSGVQGFISSVMDSAGRLSPVCSDLVSNASRMPLLRVCQ